MSNPNEESADIPAADAVVMILRNPVTRWSVMAEALKSGRSVERLRASHKKLVRQKLQHLSDAAKAAIEKEIVETDEVFLKEHLSGKLDRDGLRKAIESHHLPVAVRQDGAKVATTPPPTESSPSERQAVAEDSQDGVAPLEQTPAVLPQSVVGDGAIHIDVEISVGEDGGLAIESLTYHGLSNGEEDFGWPDEDLIELDGERLDPSEAALLDFLKASPREDATEQSSLGKAMEEALKLTDEDLLAIGAAFALREIEWLKSGFSSPMVGSKLIEKLNRIDQRMNKDAAERLVALLRDRAGTRFSEEVDDDIPF